jgi:hypothetical protein
MVLALSLPQQELKRLAQAVQKHQPTLVTANVMIVDWQEEQTV